MMKKPHRLDAKFIALLLSILSPEANAATQAVTFSGKYLQTGGQYQVTEDFNGDGEQDLAGAGLDMEIMLGPGDGNFQTSLKFPLVIGTAESALSIRLTSVRDKEMSENETFDRI